MIPVLLSGGVGSRLWPLSREMYPKQLLPLLDSQQTMLQQTLLRVVDVDGMRPPIVVCNEAHRFMVGEQLHQISQDQAIIILESTGRNTAPAIALAALHAMQDNVGDVIVVMPADHSITDQAAFEKAVLQASAHAEDGYLITFGVVANKPETGYGYIQAGVAVADGVFVVAEFKEKPNQVVASEYLEAGNYYWNSGIFVFRAEDYLAELKLHAPDVYSACQQAYDEAQTDLDFIRVAAQAFECSPSISVDYAIMEQTEKALVIPIDAGWSDVGSWSALWEVSEQDSAGNVLQGDVLTHNVHNSYIHAGSKLVAAVGIDGLIVVETDDAVMVADRNQAQQVKQIVEQLKQQDNRQLQHHRKVYRPWGWYDSIDLGEGFQVKRIQVKPGASLSTQTHQYRAEHWVVVKGEAEVVNGKQAIVLHENQSTYIPIGEIHSLRNTSNDQPLEIIEVQTGSYLGEDDIVRIDDKYGRK